MTDIRLPAFNAEELLSVFRHAGGNIAQTVVTMLLRLVDQEKYTGSDQLVGQGGNVSPNHAKVVADKWRSWPYPVANENIAHMNATWPVGLAIHIGDGRKSRLGLVLYVEKNLKLVELDDHPVGRNCARIIASDWLATDMVR